jgi:hypothetical protein
MIPGATLDGPLIGWAKPHTVDCPGAHVPMIQHNYSNKIDIMYYRLPYVFGGDLPLKTLILYISRLRGTIQYITAIIRNLFFLHK